jgi:hypothetical protein
MRFQGVTVAVLIGVLSSGLFGVALADEVRGPVVTADGYILIAIDRDGNGSGFRSKLTKPTQALSIHLGLLQFHYEEAGDCQDVFAKVNRDGRDTMTQTRRCPTSEGWKESLVRSNLYDNYEVIWTVDESGGKTQLQWELKAQIPGTAPIVLNYHMGEEMRKALGSLGASK